MLSCPLTLSLCTWSLFKVWLQVIATLGIGSVVLSLLSILVRHIHTEERKKLDETASIYRAQGITERFDGWRNIYKSGIMASAVTRSKHKQHLWVSLDRHIGQQRPPPAAPTFTSSKDQWEDDPTWLLLPVVHQRAWTQILLLLSLPPSPSPWHQKQCQNQTQLISKFTHFLSQTKNKNHTSHKPQTREHSSVSFTSCTGHNQHNKRCTTPQQVKVTCLCSCMSDCSIKLLMYLVCQWLCSKACQLSAHSDRPNSILCFSVEERSDYTHYHSTMEERELLLVCISLNQACQDWNLQNVLLLKLQQITSANEQEC